MKKKKNLGVPKNTKERKKERKTSSWRHVLPHLLDRGDGSLVGLVVVVSLDRLLLADQLGEQLGRLLLARLGRPGDEPQARAVPDPELGLPQAVLVGDGLSVGLGVGGGALLERAQELRGLEGGVRVREFCGLAGQGSRGGGRGRGRRRGDGFVEGRDRDGLEAQGGWRREREREREEERERMDGDELGGGSWARGGGWREKWLEKEMVERKVGGGRSV